jgi:hypothetical protein
MKLVKFQTNYPPYVSQETVGIQSDNVAEYLVYAGMATAVGWSNTPAIGASVSRRLKAGDSAALSDHRGAGFQHTL